MKKNLKFVFVHGLSGWGSYDFYYKYMPYWGLFGGDLITYLRQQGFPCYAASVAPTGSAWDRACELYAQIAGKRVDYGEAHSRVFRHERYGRDFSGRPLIPFWNDETRLVLLGHSFGGTTVRLFSELLAHGDEDERKLSPDESLSPFFKGGKVSRIHSIVTLTSPINGTTAYELADDDSYVPDQADISPVNTGLSKMMNLGTRPRKDGRDDRDYADYDMHIDRALALNERISTFPSVYYFSVPCSCTIQMPDGTRVPDKSKMEPMFVKHSYRIGRFSGVTKGGFEIDERWQENDGLVNTFSARAPLEAAQTALDRNHILPGVWNVFPTFDGDHLSLQGGMMRRRDVHGFYLDLLTLISDLD